MVIVAIVALYLGFYLFDFRPQYARRKELKGMWLYISLMVASFVLLMLTAVGVPISISHIFFPK